jgi:hypothetical protein
VSIYLSACCCKLQTPKVLSLFARTAKPPNPNHCEGEDSLVSLLTTLCFCVCSVGVSLFLSACCSKLQTQHP